jgi:hypothetical protein
MHAYWGAPVVPFLRYICLKSFLQYNQSWKIKLYVPVKLTSYQTWATNENKGGFSTIDYSSRIKDLGVDVVPWDMEDIGFSNDLPEVIKSDILRLYLLYNIGGLWSDSDIVYFRPLSHSVPSVNHTAYFCYRRGGPTQDPTPKNGPLYHSIGFMMGVPGNRYFKMLWENIRYKALNCGEYQTAGSPYYGSIINEQMFTHNQHDLYNFDINVVYPSRALPGMWVGPTQHYINQIRPDTIGWHHYMGHPHSGMMQNLITEHTYKNYDNVICWLIEKVLNGVAV